MIGLAFASITFSLFISLVDRMTEALKVTSSQSYDHEEDLLFHRQTVCTGPFIVSDCRKTVRRGSIGKRERHEKQEYICVLYILFVVPGHRVNINTGI